MVQYEWGRSIKLNINNCGMSEYKETEGGHPRHRVTNFTKPNLLRGATEGKCVTHGRGSPRIFDHPKGLIHIKMTGLLQ